MLRIVQKDQFLPEEEIISVIFSSGAQLPSEIFLPANHAILHQHAYDAYTKEPKGSQKEFRLMNELLSSCHTLQEFKRTWKAAAQKGIGSKEERLAYLRWCDQVVIVEEARNSYENASIDSERQDAMAKLVFLCKEG